MDSIVWSSSVNFLYPYRLKCQPINRSVLCSGLRCSPPLRPTILVTHRSNIAPEPLSEASWTLLARLGGLLSLSWQAEQLSIPYHSQGMTGDLSEEG